MLNLATDARVLLLSGLPIAYHRPPAGRARVWAVNLGHHRRMTRALFTERFAALDGGVPRNPLVPRPHAGHG